MIDNEDLMKLVLKADKLIDAATKIGVALVGYRTNKHWSGALTALIALKLAEGGNLAAGAAGLATLTYIGLNSS